MKKTAEAKRLGAGLAALDLDLALSEPLLEYLFQLQRWNRAYNLTSVRDSNQMVTRHLLDCLSLLPALDEMPVEPTSVLDVGSGAGLPGLILAMARPSWTVDVLDSNGKKARFLRHVQRHMNLQNVRVLETRVERQVCSSGYSAITSRAFASLEDFFNSTRHLLGQPGCWLAMRGRVEDNELSGLPADVAIQQVVPLRVPGLDEARHLVIAGLNR